MAEKISIGVGGAYKDVGAISIGVGGAWKTVSDAWIGVGGAWKKLYTAAVVTLTNDISGGLASATIVINADGTVDKNQDGTPTQINSGTDWIIPNGAASSAYSAYFEQVSGDAFNHGTFDTWLALSSDRSAGYTGSPGTSEGVLRVSISNDGGATTLDSADYTISIV